MRERLKVISQETLLPLGMVLSMLGAAWGAGYFYFEVKAHARAIEELKAKQDVVNMIATDVAVIRVKVERMERVMEAKR